jgi:hypothetical protein
MILTDKVTGEMRYACTQSIQGLNISPLDKDGKLLDIVLGSAHSDHPLLNRLRGIEDPDWIIVHLNEGPEELKKDLF